MKHDWLEKLQNFLQVLAFCLAIATIQYGFEPDRAYLPRLVASLCIGISIWAIVDLGRHLFPSARETGWPEGLQGLGLVVAGIVVGYVFGSRLADWLCRTNGWYTGPPVNPAADLRSSLLITLLAGIAGSYYFYSANKSAYLERKMGEVRKHANEARLKLLETQLEPHMLFNTLANLRALIAVDPARAQGMLDHMIAYLRATLDASRATTHSLQTEFDRLQDYLELMQIRLGPCLNYELLLPTELAQHPVPALLLQPLVENSIKHGLEPKVDGGHILVKATREGDRLVLRVQDTGLGESASGNGSGFGLAQVRERLAALYGEAADAQFEAVPGSGATATLRLPVQQ